MGKHTKGPWVYYTNPQPNGCPIIGDKNGLMVCMLAHSVRDVQQKEEAIANARLISAAPDILEVLLASSHIEHRLPNGEKCLCSQCEFVRMRDSAISKAIGE